MAKSPKSRPPDADRTLAMRRVLAAARGARLCYGDPVQVGARTVIPVSRVRAAGGVGRQGGGGSLEAEPVGFIDVTSQGARFEPIAPAAQPRRILAAGGTAIAGLATAMALRRRRPRRLGPPRRRSLPR